VRERFTVCLSALLLLFNAAFTVPSARVTPNGVSSRVVYSWQRHRKQPQRHRAEQLSNLPVPSRAEARPAARAAALDRAAVSTLDFSLFQRPPPALS